MIRRFRQKQMLGQFPGLPKNSRGGLKLMDRNRIRPRSSILSPYPDLRFIPHLPKSDVSFQELLTHSARHGGLSSGLTGFSDIEDTPHRYFLTGMVRPPIVAPQVII
jgi:hypothetical protein